MQYQAHEKVLGDLRKEVEEANKKARELEIVKKQAKQTHDGKLAWQLHHKATFVTAQLRCSPLKHSFSFHLHIAYMELTDKMVEMERQLGRGGEARKSK